jgi:hypothetical protein
MFIYWWCHYYIIINYKVIVMTTIDDIKQQRKFRGLEIEKIIQDVDRIAAALRGGMVQTLLARKPHQVQIGSERLLAVDANPICRYMHSSGRGDYRYLFRDANLAGLAAHTPSGGYKVIC